MVLHSGTLILIDQCCATASVELRNPSFAEPSEPLTCVTILTKFKNSPEFLKLDGILDNIHVACDEIIFLYYTCAGVLIKLPLKAE